MTGTQLNYIRLVKSGDILVSVYDENDAICVMSMFRRRVWKREEEKRPRGTYVKLFFKEV